MEEVIKTNKAVMEEANKKVQKALLNHDWDEEAWDVMSKSIKNLHFLCDIEKDKKKYYDKKEKEEVKEEYKKVKSYSLDHDGMTEFEEVVEEVIIEEDDEEYQKRKFIELINILAEHLEDIKVINKRAYDIVILKLKDLK